MKKRLFLIINKAKPQSDCSVHNSGSCHTPWPVVSHSQPLPTFRLSHRLTLESPQGLWDGGGRSPRTVSTAATTLSTEPQAYAEPPAKPEPPVKPEKPAKPPVKEEADEEITEDETVTEDTEASTDEETSTEE